MEVKAFLHGYRFDLDDLVALLPTGDTRVVQEGNSYYLVSGELDDPPVGEQFHEAAARVLRRINGLARMARPGYRPVGLGGRYQQGEQQHAVVTADTVVLRSQLSLVKITADGRREEQTFPSIAPDQLARSRCTSCAVTAISSSIERVCVPQSTVFVGKCTQRWRVSLRLGSIVASGSTRPAGKLSTSYSMGRSGNGRI